ncbi:hypothetical protein LEMLEM_LOCUS27837 [Lemmus lemmus]
MAEQGMRRHKQKEPGRFCWVRNSENLLPLVLRGRLEREQLVEVPLA